MRFKYTCPVTGQQYIIREWTADDWRMLGYAISHQTRARTPYVLIGANGRIVAGVNAANLRDWYIPRGATADEVTR